MTFARSCPECGSPLEKSASTCASCGAVYRAARERRQEKREARVNRPFRGRHAATAELVGDILNWILNTLRRRRYNKRKEERGR